MKKALLIVVSLSLVGVSCLKKTDYPAEPQLEFKSIRTTGDSAVLTFGFIDGDGDFGLGQGDTSGVFDDCLKRYNMYCEYYELQNGQWIHREIDPCIDPDAVPFYYRVPLVEPTGQIKSQKGDIRIVMTPFYFLSGEFDTCRFEAHIVDRNFNSSKVVLTKQFLKP